MGVYGPTWTYREGVGAERSSGGLGKFTIAGRVMDVEVKGGEDGGLDRCEWGV